MQLNQLVDYLLSKPAAQECYPFGPEVQVFKVGGKMFALIGYEAGVARVNLKCDPDEAVALRDIYPAILPGYHMNKKHWNTMVLDGSVPQGETERLVDNSYKLVVSGLSKSARDVLLPLG